MLRGGGVALERDEPPIIFAGEAYWRAARGSLQLDLCRSELRGGPRTKGYGTCPKLGHRGSRQPTPSLNPDAPGGGLTSLSIASNRVKLRSVMSHSDQPVLHPMRSTGMLFHLLKKEKKLVLKGVWVYPVAPTEGRP